MKEEKKKRVFKKRIFFNLLLFLFVFIGFYTCYLAFRSPSSLSNFVIEAWDGQSVASHFSGGNGTEENPYQIETGSEFAYFQECLKNNPDNYQTSSYILTADIDLGNHFFEPISSFQGTFNGNGFTISNFQQTSGIEKEGIIYYGLFSSLENATIQYFNLQNITFIPSDTLPVIIGTIASTIHDTTIESITVHDISFSLSTVDQVQGGIFAGKVSGNSTLQNLIQTVSLPMNFMAIADELEGSINNILVPEEEKNLLSNNSIEIENLYTINNSNEIKLQDETSIDQDTFLDTWNQILENTSYYFQISNEKIIVSNQEMMEQSLMLTSLTETFQAHESGVEGNTAYINDLEADWFEFLGKNYTESETGVIPTTEDKNIYQENNLVKVQITYDGTTSLEDGTPLTASISLTESVNQLVYYKVYPVSTNATSNEEDDFVIIELIDNPFANLPTDYAFNGWVSESNVEVQYQSTYYHRYLKIPVTYTENKPDDIVINLKISLTEVTVAKYSDYGDFTMAMNKLNPAGMKKVELIKITYDPYDMTGYYLQQTAAPGERYSGYNQNGNPVNNQRCSYFGNGCTYYTIIQNENYIEGVTYYQLVNRQMTAVNPANLPLVSHEEENELFTGLNMAGFFKQVTIARNSPQEGYYNNLGEALTGECTSTGGCTAYQMLTYYDSAGNIEWIDRNEEYYYLVTRDTNRIVLDSNATGTWDSNSTKPFTLTSLHNGVDYRDSVTWQTNGDNIFCYADTRIEFVKIRSTQSPANTEPSSYTSSWFGGASNTLFGNYHNVKLGRGIIKNGNYQNFASIVGGGTSGSGSSNDITKYHLIVESGYYNSIGLVNGTSGGTVYTEMKATYGSDFDRITSQNSNLDIYYCASGNWGGDLYSTTTISKAIDLTVKSGSFGTGKYDYSTGIYVGGRGGGTHYAIRSVTVEGGYIYNLIGGPLSASNRSEINDIFMSVKGGSIDMITGGAGRSATYGNRVIQITGGTINYSVFGGSNGYQGSSSEGTLNGSSYLYIGGSAEIGSEELVNANSTLYGSEAGSVFGIGNGRSEYTTVGSCDNAYIVIDGNALIRKNVYGGGNYGATGVSSTKTTTETKIQMNNGQVLGSIYGGGNKNGSGSETISSTISIFIKNGTVSGNIYGGSNEKGNIYGDVSVQVLGGTIGEDIYGGGQGGYQSSDAPGTFVSGNVIVNIGAETENEPTIEGNVYGGSAYGTVHALAEQTDVSSSNTTVTINNGIVKQSVFGGGKGNSTYTPGVAGNVTVTVNNGNIARVFGANDASGIPNGDIHVYLNGGIIGEVYGGGNNAGAKNTHVYLQGAEASSIFGGSNQTGDVTSTLVVLSNGIANNIFGGNNAGGVVEESNVEIQGGTYTSIYGGNNEGGSNHTSNVILTNGKVQNIYGGGNQAITDTTNIITQSGEVQNIYGGGNEAGATTTNIQANGATIGRIYGGSNQTGDVDTTNITSNIQEETSNDVTLEVTYQEEAVSWQQTSYKNVITAHVILRNNTSSTIDSYQGSIRLEDSVLNTNYSSVEITENNGTYSFNQDNRYYGTNSIPAGGTFEFEFTIFANSKKNDIQFYRKLTSSTSDGTTYQYASSNIESIFGGNNLGGTTNSSNIHILSGNIQNVYGGGNEAKTTNNIAIIEGGKITNVYGGGNKAETEENTILKISNATIYNNVYGGGNQAAVLKNATTTVSGDIIIGANLFAGGNSGAIGSESTNNSVATVNVSGGKITGNVYGGCNTSVVYGTTNVNIGLATIEDQTLAKGDIQIQGTVFGGGEANAEGSESYDWNFICVTVAIHVQIDGEGYLSDGKTFALSGSIFGSGNASSSSGTSDITIKNLGTKENPSRNVSIQRSDKVIIDHSYMELSGAKDRTNDYANIKYSFNMIPLLKIKNGTTLLLRENANLLESFESKVDVDGVEVDATVTIDDDTKTVIKNVDNRIYLLANTKLNIATNQAATSYGKVTGMTFFGMYNAYDNGSISYGLYDTDMSYGSSADAGDVIVGGSYIIGLHSVNHDITKDGFYTNYINDEYTELTTAYIEPTPPDASHYMWAIGVQSIFYEFELNASKYASLGTYELALIDFSKGNTIFNVIGFNSEGLTEGISLVDSAFVPKLGATEEEANQVLGLSMKSETTEWTNHGTTKFLSDNKGTLTGTKTYKTDNVSTSPSLMFYLYHAKNISLDQDLGTVVITLQALTPKNEIEYENPQFITISINLTAKSYDDGDYYDASISYGKKYEMPSATTVNITNHSQFTAYYSLYLNADSFESFFGSENNYYHVLTSNFALPVGTKITMIDLAVGDTTPEYYYYEIDDAKYQATLTELEQEHEIAYRLSDFIKMASVSEGNTYQEALNNQRHYHDSNHLVMEEYLFIFDFKDSNLEGIHLDNSILMELRNSEARCIVPVLGIRQNLMKYNLYEVSNITLQQNVSFDTPYAYYDSLTKINYETTVTYDQTTNRDSIIDTNYESSSMGINISIYDHSGNILSSSLLTGSSIQVNNENYFADTDGVFRIRLSEKVANLKPSMFLYAGNTLPPGEYTIRFVLFASEDGLHNSSSLDSDIQELTITVVGDDNSILVSTSDAMKLVDGNTGVNENKEKSQIYTITYSSELENPNIRLSLYRRKNSTSTTQEYEEISITEIFEESLLQPEAIGLIKQTPNERLIAGYPQSTTTLTLTLKEALTSGTYRLQFKLYDKNHLVDEDIEYMIIRKPVISN